METNTTTKGNEMNYTITSEEIEAHEENNWGDRKRDAQVRKHTNITVKDSNGRCVAVWSGREALRTNHGGYRYSTYNRIQVIPNATVNGIKPEEFRHPLNIDVNPVKNEEGKRVGFKAKLRDGTIITGKNPKEVWANLLNDQFGI